MVYLERVPAREVVRRNARRSERIRERLRHFKGIDETGGDLVLRVDVEIGLLARPGVDHREGVVPGEIDGRVGYLNELDEELGHALFPQAVLAVIALVPAQRHDRRIDSRSRVKNVSRSAEIVFPEVSQLVFEIGRVVIRVEIPVGERDHEHDHVQRIDGNGRPAEESLDGASLRGPHALNARKNGPRARNRAGRPRALRPRDQKRDDRQECEKCVSHKVIILRARGESFKTYIKESGESEDLVPPLYDICFFTLPFGRPSWVTQTLFRLPALYSVVWCPESRVHVTLSTMGGSLNLSVSLASVISPGRSLR